MKYLKNSKYIIIYILTIVLFMLLQANYGYIKDYLYKVNKIDTVYTTDTIYKDSILTIFKEKQVPKYIEIVKTDTFYKKDGSDTLLKTENKQYQDTFTCAKDSIIIQNFISGINSKLDSTKVDWKKSETIITNTVEITKYINKKKIHFSPTISAGYDPLNKNFGIMVGVGIAY